MSYVIYIVLKLLIVLFLSTKNWYISGVFIHTSTSIGARFLTML